MVLLTTSCTTALEMSAILCKVDPGDEVIMPSFTFVSTANAFYLRGARPVFVDIRSDTMNIDETKIEKAIIAVLTEGKVRTYDLKGQSSTTDVARAIAEKLC